MLQWHLKLVALLKGHSSIEIRLKFRAALVGVRRKGEARAAIVGTFDS
jgi:hypothetical protein